MSQCPTCLAATNLTYPIWQELLRSSRTKSLGNESTHGRNGLYRVDVTELPSWSATRVKVSRDIGDNRFFAEEVLDNHHLLREGMRDVCLRLRDRVENQIRSVEEDWSLNLTP